MHIRAILAGPGLLLMVAAVSLFARAGFAQSPARGHGQVVPTAQALGEETSRNLPIRRRRPNPPGNIRIEGLVHAPAEEVQTHQKVEIGFTLEGSTFTVPLWPYDPNSPNGVAGEEGVTVYGNFRHESGAEFHQPGFLFQQFQHEMRDGRDWIYPEPSEHWVVRFSPHLAGRWSYTVHVTERAGSAESAPRYFNVAPSDNKGFIRVSSRDSRYFEFGDGSAFYPIGVELPEHLNEPNAKARPLYQELTGSGVTLVRLWISSLFGSAWTPYIGGRNQYRGYLPNAGLVAVSAAPDNEPQLAMMLDWNDDGDTGWFDACRLLGRDSLDAVQPNTSYLVMAEYVSWGVAGPRDPRSPDYGLVIKQGPLEQGCYQTGSGTPITSHGSGAPGVWQTISGTWQSRDANFLPPFQIALDNVTSGAAFIRSISAKELKADGSLGPEILSRPKADLFSYVSPKSAFQFDRILEMAEAAGVYLKLVISEKDDEMWLKVASDGTFVTDGDNLQSYYGLGRDVNKTRWIQQSWWRYLQARWGYSPAIHSWELLNEGDPGSTPHFVMADELGRYMKYGVFGLTPPEAGPAATQFHPNAHLVTTSLWHSFPCAELWRNNEYRFVDYADLHAYISTSPAGLADRQAMQGDAAFYHLWHSGSTASCGAGKPVIRGEAGLDSVDSQSPTALGLQNDTRKLWLHNFVWSTLDAGALGEVYWWSEHLRDNGALRLQPFQTLSHFLAGVNLNEGGYEDWAGSESSGALRVVGQKNAQRGLLHLWIQNKANTWKQSPAPAPVDSTLTVTGFSPRSTFRVEYWNTNSGETSSVLTQSTDRGELSIAVQGLSTDLGVKVHPQQATN